MMPSATQPANERKAATVAATDADEQRNLLGVSHIHSAALTEAHRPDAARMMFGQLYVPTDGRETARPAYVSRQALEKALWEFRADPLFLRRARMALLRRLYFDAAEPYHVLYDDERHLYAFHPGAHAPAV